MDQTPQRENPTKLEVRRVPGTSNVPKDPEISPDVAAVIVAGMIGVGAAMLLGRMLLGVVPQAPRAPQPVKRGRSRKGSSSRARARVSKAITRQQSAKRAKTGRA